VLRVENPHKARACREVVGDFGSERGLPVAGREHLDRQPWREGREPIRLVLTGKAATREKATSGQRRLSGMFARRAGQRKPALESTT
jgi:hypothetical protein